MFPYKMVDVLTLNGIPYDNNRRSVRIICPFCGKGKLNKDMSIDLDSEKFNCYSCGISGRSATQFYALLNHMTTKEAYGEICSLLGISDTRTHQRRSGNVIPYKAPGQRPEMDEADDDIKDKTYRCFLSLLNLSDRHKNDLAARGFTENEMLSLGYASYPEYREELTPEYFDIPRKMLEQKCTLTGVPGFYTTKNKGVWTMCRRNGSIVVPYRSFFNKIVGMQLRKNEEDIKKNKDSSPSKYSWFSSNGYKDGSKASSYLHYACDFFWDSDKEQYYPKIQDNFILLTEGAMKADLTHAISGLPLIAVPGVSCANEAIRSNIPLLKNVGVKKIILAYDMDRVMNIHVLESLNRVKSLIKEEGLSVEELYWSTDMVDFKGTPFKLNVADSFVFSTETLYHAALSERIGAILEKACSLGKKQVILALENSAEITDQAKLHSKILIRECRRLNLEYYPAFWSLNLKGIDDYYAYYHRNIAYNTCPKKTTDVRLRQTSLC